MDLPLISFEDVARVPAPGMAFPVHLTFSPSGDLITYLYAEPGSLVRQLYAFRPDTGETRLLLAPPGQGATEENLSLEEKLRRERQRQRDLGVTTYAWSPRDDRLLVPFPDGLYLQDSPGSELRLLVSSSNGPVLDPRFSPDGEWVAFVQNGELHVVNVASGITSQRTFGAAEQGMTNGLAEFIAQEEMARSHGYWWSPDSRWLAFEEVDESHIPVYRIMHQGKDIVGEGAQEDHRYPFAGQPNARVRLGVVARDGELAEAAPVWMDLGPEADIYLARVTWMPDGALLAQVQDREQLRLDLLRFDPRTGAASVVLIETSSVWINLHDLFHPIKRGTYAGGFVWGSERTGFLHLYLYDASGQFIRALTSGDWLVESLAGVDEERGIVYFTATRESPLETHLYAVPLNGGEPRRITGQPGMHGVTLDSACRRFVDIWDSMNQPPEVTLRSLEDGCELALLYRTADPRIEGLALHPPEMVTLTNRHGDRLYGAIYRPPASFGSGPFPALVYVYGGPHVQMVANTWSLTTAMRAQRYARQGLLVFVLDNRGSARRGLAFEGALRHHMGTVEVEDQVDGVRWLVEQGLVDPKRVGMHGWSYGGYMTLMSLLRAPDIFRCGIAGAPVTHLDGYDTHYTERYMGLPQRNHDGYRDSSPLRQAASLRGRLMLIHGLIDENVHFRHTARLINALIRARKTYELLLFPDERHGPRREGDRVFMEEQMEAFFLRELMAVG